MQTVIAWIKTKRVMYLVATTLFLLCVAQAGAVALAQDIAQPAGPKSVLFNVMEIRVIGNSLLQKQDIERVLYPFLGESKSFDEIEAARLALESYYKDRGYPTVLVDIPEQDVQQGMVKLKVIEAKINRFKISGSRYFSVQNLRKDIPALSEGGVLYLPEFQQQIAYLNSNSPDRVLTPILRPGRVPGTVEVELKVKDKLPLHGKFEINDRYSANTSRLRTSASIQYGNLWQKSHSVSFQYQTSPKETEEVRVLMGTYVAPFKESNYTLAAYAVHSNSDVAATDTVTVIGKGNVFGMRLVFPPILEALGMHNFEIGVDYKDFGDNTKINGIDAGNTPIEYYNFNVQYTGNKTRQRGYTRFNISASFGVSALNEKIIDCLGTGTDRLEQFKCKRNGAKSNYAYLRAGVEIEERVGPGYGLFFSLVGQLADSPLISNEQFSIGGATTVRGYRESERVGDDGLMGTLELRSPFFLARKNRYIQSLYYLMFMDSAVVRNRKPLEGESVKWQLRSMGAGIRLLAFRALSAELDWAYVQRDSEQHGRVTEPEIKKGDSRVHFLVNYRF